MTGWGRTQLSDEFPGRPLSHGPPCESGRNRGAYSHTGTGDIVLWGRARFACQVRVRFAPGANIRPNACVHGYTAWLGRANLAAEDPVDADRVDGDDRQDHDPAIEQEFERGVWRRRA